jgi:hypothetical protein
MKKITLAISLAVAFLVGLQVYAFADVGSGAAAPTITAPPADSHALPAPISTTADPLDHVVEDVSRVQSLWRSGAIPSALIVSVFLTLLVLRNRVPWFAEHTRATYVAAAIAGLAMLVDCISSGQTPNLSMVIAALATATATLMRMPTKDGAA